MTIYKFAGFWRRLVAFMIDSTMVTIIFLVLCLIAGLAFFFGAMSADNNAWIADLTNLTGFSSALLLIMVFYLSINTAYFTYFHGTTGRTPGKMLLGLQVYSADGTEVSFGIAFLRAVSYLVSSLLLTFPLGFIWAAFDKKKQAWHDKIAGTVVIIKEQQNISIGLSVPDPAPVAVVAQTDGGQNDPDKAALPTATQPSDTNKQKTP